MNYSKQREQVLDVVKNSYNHPTAEMIYKEVRKENPNISLGTVYRNLNLLSEIGEIRKIPISNDHDHFDKTLYNHIHSYCQQCRTITDVQYEDLVSFIKEIEENTNYSITNYDFVVRGICPDCRRKEK